MSSFAAAKTSRSRALLVDSLTESVQDAVAASLAAGVVLPYLLEGVNVDFHGSMRQRSLSADVTLDPLLWDRDALPARGNRPRIDADTQWLWYDLLVGDIDYDAELGSPGRTRSFEEMKQLLQDQVVDLLTEIATVHLRAVISDQVNKKSKGLKR